MARQGVDLERMRMARQGMEFEEVSNCIQYPTKKQNVSTLTNAPIQARWCGVFCLIVKGMKTC